MNQKLIRVENRTEELLLSITKICETLIEQTQRKAEETWEFKMIKPRETFHLNSPTQIDGDWMLGLTDLEVSKSIFNITEENNKIELYKFPDEKAGGVSYTEVRDEIERDLGISDTTDADLQDDTIGPIFTTNNEQEEWKMLDIWMF